MNRIFKTISGHVDREIEESLYKNRTFLNSGWGFIEKSVLRWSSQYKKYIVLSFLLAALLACFTVLSQPLLRPYVATYIPSWKTLIGWQSVFLASQLTVIGVVYPLVIGLISILFQNKSAKRVLFPVYQKYSGFMFAGLSGLSLSIFIIAGYFIRPLLDDSSYVAICITSAVWLVANLKLTAWFFVTTFRMLDDKSRESIIFRFAIHETCEIDIRRRMRQFFLESAAHSKLLVSSNSEILELSDYSYYIDDYKTVSKKAKSAETLVDIWLWLANIAIWLQVFILKRKGKTGCKLVFQVHDGDVRENTVKIVKYDGFDMNPVTTWLFKLAFRYGREKSRDDIGLSTVSEGFLGPANDAIVKNDPKEFSDALDRLKLWHAEVASALSFRNNDGESDNWLQLRSNAMWGRTYLQELLAEYHRLAKDAVEKIPQNSSFYTNMLYLHISIYGRRAQITHNEERSLIQGSYYMWYLLVEWRSYSSDSNDLRVANKYEDILYNFVGAWESWLMYVESKSLRTGDLDTCIPAFTAHLEFTASTAISALRFNNFEASGWGVDMLNNWYDKFSLNDYEGYDYHWRSVLVNHRLLSLPPDSALWRSIIKGSSYDDKMAFEIAFKNAHADLRVITACYMLLKPSDFKRDILIKYIRALLAGAQIHPTGGFGRPVTGISDAGSLLGCYIRQRDYKGDGAETYGAWLSSILGSFGRIYEERKVSGRIYSGWGANDVSSMTRAYVEIAISMSSRTWTLPYAWEEAILSGAFRYSDRYWLISDLKKWKDVANKDYEYTLIAKNDVDEQKANFILSIDRLIEKIGKVQTKSITDSPLDQARLIELGAASSKIFHTESELEFPLSLFSNITHSDDSDETSEHYCLSIIDYEKERIAESIEVNRPINEKETLARSISNNVKINILRKLVRYEPTASYRYADADNALSDILKRSETIPSPVLFVTNKELIRALNRSRYEKKLAEKYQISRADGYNKEYVCHIGRCAVFRLLFNDIDYALLTSNSLFDEIKLTKLHDGRYVDVEFEPNQDNITVGTLKLNYWMRVNLLDNTQCIRLEIGSEEV